jgi:hypothetical protein
VARGMIKRPEPESPGPVGSCIAVRTGRYRLSAQRRQGNASTLSTSSPVCSSMAV